MGEPNKPPEEVDAEALEAWQRMRRGEHPRDIAADLGVSVPTIYRRTIALRAAEGNLPSAARRDLLGERLSGLYALAAARLNDPDASHSDAARLLAEARQATIAEGNLYGLNKVPPEPDLDIYEDSGRWVNGDEDWAAADAEVAGYETAPVDDLE